MLDNVSDAYDEEWKDRRGYITNNSGRGVTWLAWLSAKVQQPGTNLRRLTMASKKISWMAVSQSQLAVNGVGVGGGGNVVAVAVAVADAAVAADGGGRFCVVVVVVVITFLLFIEPDTDPAPAPAPALSPPTTSCKHRNSHASTGAGKDSERSVRVRSP